MPRQGIVIRKPEGVILNGKGKSMDVTPLFEELEETPVAVKGATGCHHYVADDDMPAEGDE